MKITIDGPDQLLYQWDTGQRLLLHGYGAGTRVDFARCGQNTAVSVYAYEQDGAVCCDIPDALLMEPNHIRGFIFKIDGDRGETVRSFLLPVIPRPKPDDYVEPEDIPTWHELEQRVARLERGGAGGGVAFDTDDTLRLENGILSVNTADAAEPDNTLPITSAAVYTQLGNIETILGTI